MRKRFIYHFRPPIWASKINQQIMFFPTRFLDLIFLICFRFVSKTVDFGTPFEIQWAPKWDPKSTNWRHIVKTSMSCSTGGMFFSRPAFPVTIVITAPFGPNCFLKAILSMQIGSLSVFFWFHMCYFLYNMFSTIFYNTTVSAQPLNPPIFEKIAPRFKTNVFHCFGSLRLRFSFVYICVDFRVPLVPPPWARLVTIFGRM